MSKHAVMSASEFDYLSAYELAEYRDHDLFKGALGECVGISVAHCFTQRNAGGAEPQDAEVHMQGLSVYGKPDACSQQSFELFLRCGFPPVAGRRCTTSWSTCKPLDGSAVQHAAGGAAPSADNAPGSAHPGLWESHWDSDAESDSDLDSEEDVTDAEADVRVIVESKRKEEQGLQVCPDTIVAVEPSAEEDADELMEAGVHAQRQWTPGTSCRSWMSAR